IAGRQPKGRHQSTDGTLRRQSPPSGVTGFATGSGFLTASCGWRGNPVEEPGTRDRAPAGRPSRCWCRATLSIGRKARPRRAPSVVHNTILSELFQVEVALDAQQDVVADHAIVAQPDDRPALGAQHLPAQTPVGLGLMVTVVVAVEARVEAVRVRAEVGAQV